MNQKSQHLAKDKKVAEGKRGAGRRKPRRELSRRSRIIILALICLMAYPRVKALLGDRSTNILLMGVDERAGDVGRSDTMMLLNYNALWGTIHLMSIPRDTRVELPGHGHQKINAAYVYGGPELAEQAVSDLTGLHVDYFVKVNFDGFAKVVDALGGVTIDIKDRMNYDDPYQDLHIHFEPGRQHLSGSEALEYVRWRGGVTADLGRVERQREFLDAALKRAVSPSGFIRSPLVLSALARCLDTDIPLLERPGLAVNIAVARVLGMSGTTVPGKTATIANGSYFIADEDELAEIISSWNRAPWSKPDRDSGKD